MATRLKNLRFNQAANLVDNPANPLAKVMLFKRADLAPIPVEQTVPPTVGTPVDAIPADASDTPVAKERTMTVKDLITKMTDLFKSVEGDDEAAEQAEKDKKAKELADAEAKKCDDMAKADAAKVVVDAEAAAEVEKSAKVVELTKALTDARAAETVAKAALAEAVEKAALADMVTVLKGLSNVSVNPDADAPIFKSLKQSNEPAFARVMEILKGADAAVDLTKAIGSDQPGDAKSGANAWAQLEAEAAKLQKEDSTVTKAKALDIVMKKRPDLVKAHYDEQGA